MPKAVMNLATTAVACVVLLTGTQSWAAGNNCPHGGTFNVHGDMVCPDNAQDANALLNNGSNTGTALGTVNPNNQQQSPPRNINVQSPLAGMDPGDKIQEMLKLVKDIATIQESASKVDAAVKLIDQIMTPEQADKAKQLIAAEMQSQQSAGTLPDFLKGLASQVNGGQQSGGGGSPMQWLQILLGLVGMAAK